MNTQQPNFEKIKTALYNAVINSSESSSAILLEQVRVKTMLPSFHTRKETFKKDLNSWLDGIDIRCAGAAIDAAVSSGAKLPDWMVRKKYIIDYNEHGFLDLHKASFVTNG